MILEPSALWICFVCSVDCVCSDCAKRVWVMRRWRWGFMYHRLDLEGFWHKPIILYCAWKPKMINKECHLFFTWVTKIFSCWCFSFIVQQICCGTLSKWPSPSVTTWTYSASKSHPLHPPQPEGRGSTNLPTKWLQSLQPAVRRKPATTHSMGQLRQMAWTMCVLWPEQVLVSAVSGNDPQVL